MDNYLLQTLYINMEVTLLKDSHTRNTVNIYIKSCVVSFIFNTYLCEKSQPASKLLTAALTVCCRIKYNDFPLTFCQEGILQ